MTRRAGITAALAVASVAVLAACGGNGNGNGGDVGGDEVTDITIGLIPVLDPGLVFIALENGYFADRGLNVDLNLGIGGATNATAMAAGEIEVGFGAYTTIFQAHAQGVLDVAIFAEANRAADGLAGIYALTESGIGAPADLAGRTLGIAQIRTIPDLSSQVLFEDAGVDYDSVDLVEMPYPDMGPALARGDFDAAWITEPFVTLLQQDYEITEVVDAYSGPLDGLAIAGFYTTKEFAEANPGTISALQEALAEAAAFAADNEDEARDLLQVHTNLSDEVMAAVALPYFPESLDAELIGQNAELMLDAGYLQEPIDMADVIIE